MLKSWSNRRISVALWKPEVAYLLHRIRKFRAITIDGLTAKFASIELIIFVGLSKTTPLESDIRYSIFFYSAGQVSRKLYFKEAIFGIRHNPYQVTGTLRPSIMLHPDGKLDRSIP
jgi:hypothetical protein